MGQIIKEIAEETCELEDLSLGIKFHHNLCVVKEKKAIFRFIPVKIFFFTYLST